MLITMISKFDLIVFMVCSVVCQSGCVLQWCHFAPRHIGLFCNWDETLKTRNEALISGIAKLVMWLTKHSSVAIPLHTIKQPEPHNLLDETMNTIAMSSNGRLVIPAPMRRKLGLGCGSVMEVIANKGSIKLKVVRKMPKQNIAELAGMVIAVSKGRRRSLDDFGRGWPRTTQ